MAEQTLINSVAWVDSIEVMFNRNLESEYNDQDDIRSQSEVSNLEASIDYDSEQANPERNSKEQRRKYSGSQVLSIDDQFFIQLAIRA